MLDFVGSKLLLRWFDAVDSTTLLVKLMEQPVLFLSSAALFQLQGRAAEKVERTTRVWQLASVVPESL